MANEVTIGGMTPVGRALAANDLLELETADGLGRSILGQEVFDGIANVNYGDQPITSSTILTNPCPSVIYVNFTTPGQFIRLPPANGANGHPAGKLIYFKVASTNTEDFDIQLNDGTVFLTAIGSAGAYNDYLLSYSQNTTQNGIPIRLFVICNASAFLPITGGTLTGNLEVDGEATPGFYGFGVTKNANAPAQINVANLNTGANARAEINANVASGSNASAIYRAIQDGGNLWSWGLDSATGDFVIGYGATFASANAYRIAQGGAMSINVLLTLPNAGLQIKDTDGSHNLSIVPGSNLTANRALTVLTGDSNRTLNISNADVTISTFGALLTSAGNAATARAALSLSAQNSITLTNVTLSDSNMWATNICNNSAAQTLLVNDAISSASRANFVQIGAGQVTFNIDTGCTIYTDIGVFTAGQQLRLSRQGASTYFEKIAPNTFYMAGSLTT